MRQVINGLIQSYPTENINVDSTDNGSTSGRPLTVFSSTFPGLFILGNNQGVPQEAINICNISHIALSASFIPSSFTFITATVNCPSNCLEAIKQAIPVGTTSIQILVGGENVGSNNPVLVNETGLVVTGDQAQTDFINTCYLQSIRGFTTAATE